MKSLSSWVIYGASKGPCVEKKNSFLCAKKKANSTVWFRASDPASDNCKPGSHSLNQISKYQKQACAPQKTFRNCLLYARTSSSNLLDLRSTHIETLMCTAHASQSRGMFNSKGGLLNLYENNKKNKEN